jgi:uncharacterized lipoprotein YehR (DUF1307 family)
MKKIIPFLLIIALAGCGKKEWSKEYMAKKCNTEMKKNSQIAGMISAENIVKICDCVGEKIVVNYKSEAAANKDESGVKELSKDCTIGVLMPKDIE